jgi:tetratricopeptide (TPR) repeat protein
MRPCSSKRLPPARALWLAALTTGFLLAAPGGAWQKAPRAQGQVAFGVDMAQRGLWSEALFRFRQAEKLGDTRASVLNNIAVAFEALGQFDQAQDYYKKALDQDPRNAGLKRNYSRFVEFYQSFKPDQPGQPPEDDLATATGDGETPQDETGKQPPPRDPSEPSDLPPDTPGQPTDPPDLPSDPPPVTPGNPPALAAQPSAVPSVRS